MVTTQFGDTIARLITIDQFIKLIINVWNFVLPQ